MTTLNGLPIYRATLSSKGDGVIRVSLVDQPAVESNFDVFAAQVAAAPQPVRFAIQDEEKRIVRGVVLRADFPIYRRDKEGDPGYYVTFDASVIRQAAERLLAEGHANDVNLQHEDGSDVQGVQMVQLFLKDSAAGINPEGFDDIADGSLFAEYHVTNDDVWDEIKAGTFKGFSVEIFYTLIPLADTMARQEEESFAPALQLLRRIITKIHDMSKLEKFKARLAAILAEFGSVTTDKGVIYWDGDEDLKAGDRVSVEDADGNRQEASDGDYTTADGKVIVVADGAVAEIRDPEAEVAPENEDGGEDSAEKMARQRAARFEESYDEKMRKIAEAIRAARGKKENDYGHLVSAGDDFAVWAYYSEETGWEDRYVRYAIAWDQEGNATASDPVDVRTAFVPVDFDDAALFDGAAPSEEDFEKALKAAEDFKAENATLKARIAELEKTPAGKPVAEQYKQTEEPVSTGDAGLDTLSRCFRKK